MVAVRVHKRSIPRAVDKILTRIDHIKNGVVSRSKKAGIPCSLTLEQLRELVEASYGLPCRYCTKILTFHNFVLDHRVPMSKGGTSDLANLQLCCRTSNGVKGSLSEEHFLCLLAWLETQPEELRRDVTIRLARGVV